MMFRKQLQNHVSAPKVVSATEPPLRYTDPISHTAPQPDEGIRIRVEDRLDAACAPLIGTTSYIDRQELRNEMRQHLYSLILAYQELGETPEAAVEKALKKFGDPAVMAQQWNLAALGGGVRSNWRRRLKDQRHGIGVTLALCGLMGVFGFALRGTLPGTASLPQYKQQGQSLSVAPRFESNRVPMPQGFPHNGLRNVACTACHTMSSALWRFPPPADATHAWNKQYGIELYSPDEPVSRSKKY